MQAPNIMYKFRLYLFLFLSFQLISISGTAQLVNTESSRKEKKEGLQGNISVGFSFSQTTTDITQFQNNAGLQYTAGRHTYLLLNSIEFLRVKTSDDRRDLANQNFQHFRYNYHFRDSASAIWEYFLQHQQNKIKYQDLRIVTGTGPRFRIFESNRFSLFICPLVMYEHEQEFEAVNIRKETHVFKGDLYAVIVYKITEDFNFRHVTYYQPALMDFTQSTNFEPVKDFRIASETSFTFKLFKNKLEFSTLFNLSHDSRPPGLFVVESGKDRMTFIEVKNEIRVNF